MQTKSVLPLFGDPVVLDTCMSQECALVAKKVSGDQQPPGRGPGHGAGGGPASAGGPEVHANVNQAQVLCTKVIPVAVLQIA